MTEKVNQIAHLNQSGLNKSRDSVAKGMGSKIVEKRKVLIDPNSYKKQGLLCDMLLEGCYNCNQQVHLEDPRILVRSQQENQRHLNESCYLSTYVLS